MSIETTTNKIRRGDKFTQTVRVGGVKQVREIKIISGPTLSSSVSYRILRNDAHPHRVGKTGTIRRADLYRKYEAA